MKVLVFGVGGFTGRYIYKALTDKALQEHSVIGVSTHEGDYAKIDLSGGSVYKQVEDVSPDVVCLPAGITHVDYIEKHPSETRLVNVDGAAQVIDYCKDTRAKFVYFSTDAVFDGKSGPNREDDSPDPHTEYGRQKLEVEKLARMLENHVIIRTSSIYGWDSRNYNFVARLIHELRQNHEFKTPTDQYYTPTYVVDLANATRKLVEEGRGLFNVTGPDFLNRYELALSACDIFGLKRDLVIPVDSRELQQAAKRPEKSGLRNDKAVAMGIQLSGVEQGLRHMKEHHE